MARFEWIILELLVLGLLVAELIKTRRAIARDRARAEQEKPRQP